MRLPAIIRIGGKSALAAGIASARVGGDAPHEWTRVVRHWGITAHVAGIFVVMVRPKCGNRNTPIWDSPIAARGASRGQGGGYPRPWPRGVAIYHPIPDALGRVPRACGGRNPTLTRVRAQCVPLIRVYPWSSPVAARPCQVWGRAPRSGRGGVPTGSPWCPWPFSYEKGVSCDPARLGFARRGLGLLATEAIGPPPLALSAR